MTTVADWGWGNPSKTELVADQFSGVARYLSVDQSKRIHPDEATAEINAGLQIVLVEEDGATAFGRDAGVTRGQIAVAQAREVGALRGAGIYLAQDDDVPEAQWAQVAAAQDGFSSVVRPAGFRSGFYGKAALGDQLWRDGHLDLYWQTQAWSGRYVSAFANLYQRAQQVNVSGTDVDINVALTADYGQWPARHPQPTPSAWKVTPMFNPPLRPIRCSTPLQGGGVLAVADDGSSYYIDAPAGYPAHAGMNADPADWGNRVPAEVRVAEQFTNKPWTLKDTAGEFYDLGYQPGQVPLRW